MLLRFRVTNHASLRDEQELSLIADDCHADRTEVPVPGTDEAAVAAVSVFGANASGKSNVIDAVVWMRSAVLSSFRRWDPEGGVPRRPFALRGTPGAWESSYAVDFVVGGVRYEYGFTVDDHEIRQEWLHSYPEGRRRRLFEREAGRPVAFGRGLGGRRKVIADLLRPNSLYLSVAAAQGHELLGGVYRWFRNGLRVASDHDFGPRLQHTVDMLLEGGERGRAVRDLLRYADLGVDSIDVLDPDQSAEEERERVAAALKGALGDRVRVEHSVVDRVVVEHRTGEGTFGLRLGEESSGTRTWIGLLGPVLTAMSLGSALCVDELDARLHPYLVDAVVGMFQDPKVNLHGAQLVFSTHEAGLLGRTSRTELRRDQVWFTEKDHRTGATRLYPLTEYRVRDSVENLEKRYLEGRYGAVPFLDDDVLGDLAARESCGQGDGGGSAEREESPATEGDEAGRAEIPHLLRR